VKSEHISTSSILLVTVINNFSRENN